MKRKYNKKRKKADVRSDFILADLQHDVMLRRDVTKSGHLRDGVEDNPVGLSVLKA